MSEEKTKEINPPSQPKIPHYSKANLRGTYLLQQTLGEGAFAKVKLGLQINTNEKTAIKIFDKFKVMEDENDIQKFKKEINILKRLRHKNIIQLYEVMESKSKLYIVMEYCEGGEFFDYIANRKRIPEDEACSLFQQIINGVEYIHEQNIIHRDLKPENILLDYNMNIKISDFGLSTFNYKNSYLQTACGTPSYAPPEMLRGESYKGSASDIWSCGIILYAMLCGCLPFSESREEVIEQEIMTHNYTIPSHVSKEARNLLDNIMNVNPEERYTIADIKKHPWFNMKTPFMKPGLTIGKHKIPVDEKILDMVENYGFNREKCRELVLAHKYCPITSVYYLCVKKYIREGGSSVSDLSGSEFEEYINDPKNQINPELLNFRGNAFIRRDPNKYNMKTETTEYSENPIQKGGNINSIPNNTFIMMNNEIIASINNNSPQKLIDRTLIESKIINEEHVSSKTPILVGNSSAKNINLFTNKNKLNLSKNKKEKGGNSIGEKRQISTSGKHLIKVIVNSKKNFPKKENKQIEQHLITNKQPSNHQIKGIRIIQTKNIGISQEVANKTKKKLKDFSSNIGNPNSKDIGQLLNSVPSKPSNSNISKKKMNTDDNSNAKTNSKNTINSNKNSFINNTNGGENQSGLNYTSSRKKKSQKGQNQSYRIQSTNEEQANNEIESTNFQNTPEKENNTKSNHRNQKSSPCPNEEFKLDNEEKKIINLEEIKFDNVLEYISKRLVAKSFCGSFNFPPTQSCQPQQTPPIKDEQSNKINSSSFKNTVTILHQKYKAYFSKNSNKNYLNKTDENYNISVVENGNKPKKEFYPSFNMNKVYPLDNKQIENCYGNTERQNKFLDISTNYIQGFDSKGESSIERPMSIKSNELRNFSFSSERKNTKEKLNSSFSEDKPSSLTKFLSIDIISEDDEFKINDKRKMSHFKKRKEIQKADKKITINLSTS